MHAITVDAFVSGHIYFLPVHVHLQNHPVRYQEPDELYILAVSTTIVNISLQKCTGRFLSKMAHTENVIYILFQDGWTALFIASLQGHSPIVEALLMSGAHINTPTEVKVTVLMGISVFLWAV